MPTRRIVGESISDKFNRFVIRNSVGCWGWDGPTFKEKKKNRVRAMLWDPAKGGHCIASRVSWTLHYGPIPKGIGVLHHCDNTLCTRPDCLFLGDQKDNMQDATRKGRHWTRLHGHVRRTEPDRSSRSMGSGMPCGERHWKSKLTVDLVREVKRLLRTGLSSAQVASATGVSVYNVKSIRRGDNWAWVE